MGSSGLETAWRKGPPCRGWPRVVCGAAGEIAPRLLVGAAGMGVRVAPAVLEASYLPG